METSAQSTSRPTPPALGWEGLKQMLASPQRLATDTEGSQSCLRVMGALDKRVAREIKAQAKALAAAEGNGWSLDLSAVRHWDAEGLSALVYALDVSEMAGKELTLLDPSPQLRQTLELAQLHHLFQIRSREA